MYIFTLNKGENYHLQSGANGVEITYSQGGIFYGRTFAQNKLSPPVQSGYADQKLNLFDGKKLVLRRGEITIE